MKFKFDGPVVVNATSEEDALQIISGRLSTIARRLGNGQTLEECGPWFTLVQAEDGAEAKDITTTTMVPIEQVDVAPVEAAAEVQPEAQQGA